MRRRRRRRWMGTTRGDMLHPPPIGLPRPHEHRHMLGSIGGTLTASLASLPSGILTRLGWRGGLGGPQSKRLVGLGGGGCMIVAVFCKLKAIRRPENDNFGPSMLTATLAKPTINL
jgi:hypothetical protein